MTDQELTPQAVLALYRERSSDQLNAQARIFRRMPERDRAELMFYMVSHLTMAMQDAVGAPTISLDEATRLIRGDA